jgi:hypothetical protein
MALGHAVGVQLIALGIGYITIAWRLRQGERWVWTAAIVLPIVHIVAMSALDLVLLGEIPSENYPVVGLVAVILVRRTSRRPRSLRRLDGWLQRRAWMLAASSTWSMNETASTTSTT